MNGLSKVNDLFSRLVDLLLMNLLFLLTSLPLISIGPSLCALYSVNLKMVRGEDGHLIRAYFRSFRENFRQACPASVLFGLGFALLLADLRIAMTHSGTMYLLVGIFSGIALAALSICFLYFFPILSRFQFTVKQVFVHMLAMIGSQPKTLGLLVLLDLPFVFFLCYSVYTAAAVSIFLCIIGFSALTHVQATLFQPLFAPYERS